MSAVWSDFSVINLQGPLDITSLPYLVRLFERVERRSRVTLNLRAVEFIDASALSCFVRLHNSMFSHRELPGSPAFEARIRLIDVQPNVARLIRLVHLDELFEMCEPAVPAYGEVREFPTQRVVPLTRAPELTKALPI